MKIRNANKDDLEVFSKFKKLSVEDYKKISGRKIKMSKTQIDKEFKESLSSPKKILLFLELEGENIGFLIGTLITTIYKKTGFIDDVFVIKGYREKGFGKKLINHFMGILKKKNFKYCRLGVETYNTKASNIYKKLGFKITHYDMEKKIK